MTNTRITDPEILERRYPVLLRQFLLRTGSGGRGLRPGGDGVVREIEFLRPLACGILSERRAFAPYGLHGGGNGARGVNLILCADGRTLNIGRANTYRAQTGDRIQINSPGGGAFGRAADADGHAADGNGASAPAAGTNAVAAAAPSGDVPMAAAAAGGGGTAPAPVPAKLSRRSGGRRKTSSAVEVVASPQHVAHSLRTHGSLAAYKELQEQA
jgi:hypothetical protein